MKIINRKQSWKDIRKEEKDKKERYEVEEWKVIK